MARDTAKPRKLEEKLEDTLENLTEDATQSDLQAQVEQLKEDIAALASTLADMGAQTVRDARRTVRRQGEDAVDELKSRAQDLEAQLTAAVREKPIASLAMALGAGYVLALLSRR